MKDVEHCSSCQEKFEEWYRSKWPKPVNESAYRWGIRRLDGMYISQNVRLAWQAWDSARQQTKRECADALRVLVSVLDEKSE